MAADREAVTDRVHRRYRFFRSTFFERRMLFDRQLRMAFAHKGASQRNQPSAFCPAILAVWRRAALWTAWVGPSRPQETAWMSRR